MARSHWPLLAIGLLWASKRKPAPSVPEGPAGGHAWARDVLARAFIIEKARAAFLRELQFLAAWSWVETQYGRSRLLPAAGRDAHNWGAVMCHSPSETACFVMQDQFADGRKFTGRFRVYPNDLEGARDLIREAASAPLRPRSGSGLASADATIFRIALAERREGYYGGTCPKEIAAAKAAGRPLDKSLCEVEAVTGRALAVRDAMASIAAALGEQVALPLGTFADALAWWWKPSQQPTSTSPVSPATGGGMLPVGPALSGSELTPAIVAWAKEVKAIVPELPMGWVVGPRVFDGVPVLARVEIHGANSAVPRPHRGVGVHHLPA